VLAAYDTLEGSEDGQLIKSIQDLDQILPELPGFNSAWKKRLEKNKHFSDYLKSFLSSNGKDPTLVESLNRELGVVKEPNFIYPVGDPVLIHIYTDQESKNTIYKTIEPRLNYHRDLLLGEVERRIALSIDETVRFDSIEDKTDYLYNLLDSFVEVDDKFVISNTINNFKKDKGENKGLINRFKKGNKKLKIDPETYERLKYEVYCEKVGSSLLEPMIRDIYIEDIHCSGLGPVHVSHKIFGTVESTISLDTQDELDAFVLKLSEFVQKPVSHRDPIADGTMPDGSRINIVYGEDVSRRGSNFTIRKFSKNPLSILQITKWGTMNTLIAAYIWILLEEKMSIWICGETASGKTTTLSAITCFIPDSYKIVSIEEVPEVHVPHKNWVRGVVRETGDATSEEQGAVSMFQLLKAALRQRPNYIIVGEIRGQEGNIAFQAMQTGHPSMATFHAATVSKLVQRLTNYPINVPKTHIDNLNAAVFQSAVHDEETGRYKRRVLTVNEILGYEPAEGVYNFVEVFNWDPSDDHFEFRGLGTSYLLDSKVAVMRGYTGAQVTKIYDELYRRAEILEYMIALDILAYDEVVEHFRRIQRMDIEEAYKTYKRMAVRKLGRGIEREVKEKLERSR